VSANDAPGAAGDGKARNWLESFFGRKEGK
jgi:hypothetical protein